eukprot:gb/GEZN01009849.1/.p1 GENE.gb/GEZN01009849.1/~~gb/GEZN01009849.1/.p1  ORF type:complete len:421 (+),score=55.61 gb/GEZN01009849.1/:162-1265(+)
MSVGLQLILYGLILGALYGQHSNRPVDCFGAIFITVIVFLVVVQMKYVREWKIEDDKNDYNWHRDNLFLPLYIEAFAVCFSAWGLLVMLAQTGDGTIWNVSFDHLNGLGWASFLIPTITVIPILVIGFILSEMHLNRVGIKWNCCNGNVSHHIAIAARIRGTFTTGFYRKNCKECLEDGPKGSWFSTLAVCYCFLITFFLIFTALAIIPPDARITAWSVVFLVLYCIFFLATAYYAKDAVAGPEDTPWNRDNLLVPCQTSVACLVLYFASQAILFFDSTGSVFQTGWNAMSTGERTLWVFIIIFAFLVIFIMNVLTTNHLAWWKRLTEKETLVKLKSNSRWRAWGRTREGQLIEVEIEDETFYNEHS